MKADFTTSCLRENLGEVRSFVSSVLTKLKVPSALQYKIVLAVDEACANAIIHGNDCDSAKSLKVELETEEDCLYIRIYDVGQYTESSLNTYTKSIQDHIKHRDKGGLGLKLIHLIMDEVTFYKEDQHNVCQLLKVLG